MNFWEYCKDRKMVIFGVFAVTFAVYAMWAVQDIVTFDAEGLYNLDASKKWSNLSIMLGRWGTYYIKKVFGTQVINPYFSVTMFFICFPVSAIIWLYNFFTWEGEKDVDTSSKYIGELIFGIIYLTHPIWAFVFSYRSHMEVVCFALSLAPVVLLLLTKAIEYRSYIYVILACVLAAVLYSCYSTFMILYGVGICIYLYYKTSESFEESGSKWKLIIKLLLFTVASVVLYYIIVKITKAHFGITGGTEYLTGNFKWGSEPIADSFNRLLANLKSFFWGSENIYSPLYLISSLSIFLLNVYKAIKKTGNGWCILFSIGIIISPLLLNIITAGDIVIRGQIPFVLSLAFLTKEASLLFIAAIGRIGESRFKVELKRLSGFVGVLIFGFFVVHQTQFLTRWMYSDVKVMQMDFDVLEEIYFEAMENGGQEGDALVLVGGDSCYKNDSLLTGEVIGYSYFAFNGYYYTNAADWAKVIEAMNAVGYNVTSPTEEQHAMGYEMAADMNEWPAEGSIKVVDNVIVVKLHYEQ